MEWNRSETIALAAANCVYCGGLGLKNRQRQEGAPCACVLRAIFRACYERFRECANKDIDSSRVSLEYGLTREGGNTWGRKNEEYVADFLLVAKRALTPQEHRIFRYHYLLGADWRLCCRKLNMDKGLFFHAVYRIQRKLGYTFRTLQPYPLYPLRDYFGTSMYDRKPAPVVPIRQETKPLARLVPVKRNAA